MLTYNQIAIQATQKLTWNIMSDKCKGLKGVYGSLEKPHEEEDINRNPSQKEEGEEQRPLELT
jgi:hypothetical protein